MSQEKEFKAEHYREIDEKDREGQRPSRRRHM
jgi:hypothetical protein